MPYAYNLLKTRGTSYAYMKVLCVLHTFVMCNKTFLSSSSRTRFN